MTNSRDHESDLYADTIAILTRAATTCDADGTTRDFADCLAHVLAVTAAHVGGPDRLVAGRPGSWESCYVDSLVRRTIGNPPDDWSRHCSQPTVIPLNVAELIEDERHHPGLMGLGEALENFDKHFDTLNDDCDVDAWDHGINTITARYTAEYRLYAERFTDTVRHLGNQIPGLTADVYVEADSNPNSHWWLHSTINNPGDTSDPLAQQLWFAAHHVTPLPNIDIWLGTSPKQLTKE